MNATKFKLVFTATRDWLDTAERQGLEINWDAEPLEWEEIQVLADLAGEDPEDYELGAAVLSEPREGNTALQAGDIVLTAGPGSNAYFFRAE